MPRIIDLDLIAPIGVTVRKDGKDYKLPGDPPLNLWLGIIDANDQLLMASASDQRDALELFHERMLHLFRIENPDLDELPFGAAGMFTILSGFYGAQVVDEEEPDPQEADEARSTTRTKSGRASSPAKTTSRKTTATRSRSSR